MKVQLIAATALLSGFAQAQTPQAELAMPTAKPRPVASQFNSTNGSSFSMGSDSCATPTVIMGQGMFAYDITMATQGTEGQNETLCDIGGTIGVAADVWFEWTADATGRARLSTCGGVDDTKVVIWPGGACPTDGTSLSCKDDSDCALQTTVVWDVTMGTTYLLQVGLWFDPMIGVPTIAGTTMEMFDLTITPAPAPYQLDWEGTTTNALGLANGGEQLFINGFEADGGTDVISAIEVVYGFNGGTSSSGLTARIAVYDDPTNDFDPTDAVLLHVETVPQANANTDIFNSYTLTTPVAVNGVFYIGASVRHQAGEFPCPMDQRLNSLGRSWYAATIAPPLDVADLSAAGPNGAVDIQTVGTGTFDCVWLVRGVGAAGVVYPEGCNGDGGDGMGCSDCPCGNNSPSGTIGGCINSASTSSRLLATGVGSATGSNVMPPLRFECSGVAPSNSCQLTSGNAAAPANAANPCFGLNSGITSVSLDGLRCAVQGVLRHGVRPSDANGDVGVTTNGWGGSNNFFNYSTFTAGQTKFFQVIHRDDAAAVCGTGQNTTQYVEVTFTP